MKKYYVLDPRQGIETCDSENGARELAELILSELRELAKDPEYGWDHDIERLEWGELRPMGQATVLDRSPPEDDEEEFVSECCDYALTDVTP